MKRVVCLLLVFVLFIVCAVGVVPVSAADDDVFVPLGDANTDGDVDIIDATIIRRYCVNFGNNLSFLGADVDGDGYISVIDATFIQRYLAGMTVPYDVNVKQVPVAREASSAVDSDKTMTPLFGDGSAYLNGVLWSADDAIAFRNDVISRSSVSWFFDKYHLTEDYGWTIYYTGGYYFDESLSDDVYDIRMQRSLSQHEPVPWTDLAYKITLLHDNDYSSYGDTTDFHFDCDLSIHCGSGTFDIGTSTHIAAAHEKSDFMKDFSEPFVFNKSFSFFGKDSIASFDIDSYRGLLDACDLNVSDFGHFESMADSDERGPVLDCYSSHDYRDEFADENIEKIGSCYFRYARGEWEFDPEISMGGHLSTSGVVNYDGNPLDVDCHRDVLVGRRVPESADSTVVNYISEHVDFRVSFW